jgi:hypothetical protein
MAKFQIQQASSTVNWTGKKVLGLHTGSIYIANGFIEITDNTIVGGEIEYVPSDNGKSNHKVITIFNR